jgi:hypothetical protein
MNDNVYCSTEQAGRDANSELVRAQQDLARLTTRLSQAVAAGSAEDVLRVGREAEAIRRVLEVVRFDLKCQNRFWDLRVHAMGEFGNMIRLMEKHPGGRPAASAKAPPRGRRFLTIGEIQAQFKLSDRFIQQCREISALDPRDIDSYVAKGQADPPQVLCMKGPNGLMHHAGWESTRAGMPPIGGYGTSARTRRPKRSMRRRTRASPRSGMMNVGSAMLASRSRRSR